MTNTPSFEIGTVCSYEQWLEFRQNRYTESLYDKWKAVLESTNSENAMIIQSQERNHTPINLTEFIETIKNNFIGFCLTPVFIYESNVYSAKSAKTTKTSAEDAKMEVIDFLESKKNLILYDVDFCASVDALTDTLIYSIIIRYGEVDL
jgi:hypothetical protein